MSADFAGHTPESSPWPEIRRREIELQDHIQALEAERDDLRRQNEEQAREIERPRELYDATVEVWTQRLAAAESALLAEQALRAEVTKEFAECWKDRHPPSWKWCTCESNPGEPCKFCHGPQILQKRVDKALALTPGEALRKHNRALCEQVASAVSIASCDPAAYTPRNVGESVTEWTHRAKLLAFESALEKGGAL